MWKTLRVNTNEHTANYEDLKESYRMLGGRGLVAQFLLDEVDPTCEPLGPDNKLLFCTGILAGTGVTAANRLSVGGKSPLTGGVKESNSGGMAGTLLASHGIKMLILEDQPKQDDKWYYLLIDSEGKPSFEPADEIFGKGTYDTMEYFVEKHGDGLGVMAIGGAGEMGYKNSCIAVNEYSSNHPSRMAARGGLGSVMGSKHIKAIVLEKPKAAYKPQLADEAAFNENKNAFNKGIAEASKVSPFSTIGTISNVAATSPAGILPTRNFSGEYFKDHEKIGPEKFMETLATRGGKNQVPCQPGCMIRCSNRYNDAEGNYLTSGFEYETVGLCGSNLNISNLDDIARIDRFCDDFGCDTIETGATLGICMYEGKIPWGDVDAVFGLLEEMKQGSEFGRFIGDGAFACGTHLGSTHIPVSKKQAMPAYEPRNLLGTGVTYATTPQGADHTTGVTLGTGDGTTRNMQLYLSNMMQSVMGAADNYACLFIWATAMTSGLLPLVSNMVNAMYGAELGTEFVMGGSVQAILTEREFNRQAGFTLEDDDLPEFMKNEPSPMTGNIFDFTPEEMVTVHNFV